MNSRILLLAFAVVAVGMFALPNTLSLFAGQHTFDNGPNVNCKKCHMDIYEELGYDANTGLPHNMGIFADCQVCHRTGDLGLGPWGARSIGISKDVKLDVPNQTGAHAAITVECVFCHDLVPKEINNVSEIHTKFVQNATSTRTLYYNNGTPKPNNGNQSVVMLKGANTACVGCHTHIWVNSTWVRDSGYGINIDETSGTYAMNFTLNSTPVKTTVLANTGT